MSAKSKLAGKLPGDDQINGLDAYNEECVALFKARDPKNPPIIMSITLMRVRDIRTVITEDGLEEIPTWEHIRLEVLGVTGDEPTEHLDVVPKELRQLLTDTCEKRTGKAPLPFDAISVDDARIEIIGGNDEGAQVIQLVPGGDPQ